ncbi:MAG TPA: site-specific integrase, partial [Steroidobacteraceae bacterium]|nr:site-specific integrase [Steroidobacteraceae bacterium]
MSPDALDSIARFRRHLATERRYSPHTDSNYARELAALVRFCDARGIAEWRELDSQHLRVFAAQSHASGLAPRSIQRRLSAVRSFLRFLLVREKR